MGAQGDPVNIARPAKGFKIEVAPAVQAFVDQMAKDDSRFFWRWETVLARLRGVGHVTGAPIDTNPSERGGVFTVDGWKIKVVWRVLGDTVTIRAADF